MLYFSVLIIILWRTSLSGWLTLLYAAHRVSPTSSLCCVPYIQPFLLVYIVWSEGSIILQVMYTKPAITKPKVACFYCYIPPFMTKPKNIFSIILFLVGDKTTDGMLLPADVLSNSGQNYTEKTILHCSHCRSEHPWRFSISSLCINVWNLEGR